LFFSSSDFKDKMEQIVRTSKQKYSNLPTKPFSARFAEGKHLIFFFLALSQRETAAEEANCGMHYTPTKYLTDYTGSP